AAAARGDPTPRHGPGPRISLAGAGRGRDALAYAPLQCLAGVHQCGGYARTPGVGAGPRRPTRGSWECAGPQRLTDEWGPPHWPRPRGCRDRTLGGRVLFSPQWPQLSGPPGRVTRHALALPPALAVPDVPA